MPDIPQKFFKQIDNNFKVENLYGLSGVDLENYRQYMFAKKQYDELAAFLNNTSEATDEDTKERIGYGKNKYGFELELDQDMLELITDKTEKLFLASKNFIEKLKIDDNTKTGTEILMYDARKDNETSLKILTTLSDMSMSNPMSFLEVCRKSTEVTIDLGNTEIDTAGAALSSRLALKYVNENGEIIKGFFTKDKETGNKINFSSEKNAHPEFKKALTEVEHFINEVEYDLPEAANDCLMEGIGSKEDVIKILGALGAKEDTLQELNELDFEKSDVQDIVDAILNYDKSNELNREMGIKGGNNLNQRNTFMSDMAEVLGKTHILAKSTPMTIIENGEAVHGNFMENAIGVDYNKIDPKDPFFAGKTINVNYRSVVKDIADMMILDYICLNGDRHQNNMFYQFVADNDGTISLIGIQGIDNDLSFGNRVPEDSEEVKFIPPLNRTNYITRSMMEKVNELTKAKIYSMYAGKGLSEEEIEACWKRTQKLQNKIKDNKFRIIEDKNIPESKADKEKANKEAEKAYKMIMYEAEEEHSQFISPVTNIELMKYRYEEKQQQYKKEIDSYKYRIESFATENKISKDDAWVIIQDEFRKKVYAEFTEKEKENRIKEGLKGLQQKIYLDSKLLIKNQSTQISKLYGKLWRPKDKDVPEYKNLYKTLKDLNETLTAFKIGKDKKGQILSLSDDMKQNILAEKFKETEEKIQAYQQVISKEPSRNDKKRIVITESIKSIAIDNRNTREILVNQINTSMVKAMDKIEYLSNQVLDLKNEKNRVFEFKMANMKLDATVSLSAYLGNLDMPKDEKEKSALDKEIAKICIVNKLSDLRDRKPYEFYTFASKVNENPDACLKSMVDDLCGNADFKKIMAKVNPANAIMIDTPERIKKLADEIGIFDQIGIKFDEPVQKKENDIVQKKQ